MSRQPSQADLMSIIGDLQRRVKIMETAPQLGNAAIGKGGLRFYDDGEATFEGASGGARSEPFVAGETGWRLRGDSAEFNNLTLRGGIIGNDALSSPVRADYASAKETGWGTSTTDATRAATSIAVPAGFTQALVQVTTSAAAINNTAASDYLYLASSVAGVESNEMFGLAGGNNGSSSLTTAKSTLLTGLSGGSIQVAARIHTGFAAWAANGVNRAYVEALAVFLR